MEKFKCWSYEKDGILLKGCETCLYGDTYSNGDPCLSCAEIACPSLLKSGDCKLCKWKPKKPKIEWVSVENELPDIRSENNTFKITDTVIAWDGTYKLFGYFKIYNYDESWKFTGINEDDYEWGKNNHVTHWLKNLEPPEEGLT